MVRQRRIWLAVSSCRWQLEMGSVRLASDTCTMPRHQLDDSSQMMILHAACSMPNIQDIWQQVKWRQEESTFTFLKP